MPVVVPAFIVLFGLLLRLVMLGVDVRFHPDEALFAAQARLISHGGDWNLRTTDLDKPPLTFYITALSFRLFGSTETASRLPNVVFSSLSIAGIYVLADALYRDQRLAQLAALLLAICPYDLAFAATVFTDVQATFWTVVAVWFAARDQWRCAGCATALLFAAKSNTLLFLPLIIMLGITRNARREWTWQGLFRRVWNWTWPFALGVSGVMLWDLGRAPRSFLGLSYQRNHPGRFIRADELTPRLEQWWHWLTFITGSEVVLFILFAGVILGLIARLRQRSRRAALDWQIVGFGIAFLAGHWLIAFNTYDRYLHTLVPFVLLSGARAVIGICDTLPRWTAAKNRLTANSVAAIGSLILAGTMLPGTITTLRGAAHIGGDQGQHTGIDELATYLNTTLNDEIVYDHWLGWELAYYLGQTPRVYLVYQPLPADLANAMQRATTRRFFVAPSPAIAAPWLAALHHASITTSIVYNQHFVVYSLTPANIHSPMHQQLGREGHWPVYSEWDYQVHSH